MDVNGELILFVKIKKKNFFFGGGVGGSGWGGEGRVGLVGWVG